MKTRGHIDWPAIGLSWSSLVSSALVLPVSQDTAPSAAVRATRGTPILPRILALPITGVVRGLVRTLNSTGRSVSFVTGRHGRVSGKFLRATRCGTREPMPSFNAVDATCCSGAVGDHHGFWPVIFFSQTTGGNHMHDMQDLQMVVN